MNIIKNLFTFSILISLFSLSPAKANADEIDSGKGWGQQKQEIIRDARGNIKDQRDSYISDRKHLRMDFKDSMGEAESKQEKKAIFNEFKGEKKSLRRGYVEEKRDIRKESISEIKANAKDRRSDRRKDYRERKEDRRVNINERMEELKEKKRLRRKKTRAN